MFTTIFFDLDGTLLPMNQEQFVQIYFTQLSNHFAPLGFDTQTLLYGIKKGTDAMFHNDGKITNETLFWNIFTSILKEKKENLEPEFEHFYKTSFTKTKEATYISPFAVSSVRKLKKKGYKMVVATNPVFPPTATLERIEWAGLNPSDFTLVTTYDNSSFCKPNLNYYQAILTSINQQPKNCIMVGNDTTEDMVCAALGFSTYLITDCLINTKNLPLTYENMGSFQEFESFVDSLPSL